MTENQIHMNHPIELTSTGGQPNYVIPTHDQISFNNFVDSLIDSRIRGGIVVADSGIGKTTAIRTYTQMKSRDKNNRPGISTSTLSAVKGRTSKQFFYNLLKGLSDSIDVPESRGFNVYIEQYILHLTQLALENNGNLLIFIDEAQHMTENEYYYLMSVVNTLSGEELFANVTTVLVGTKELLTKKMLFIKSGKNQIVNRFQSMELELKGITSVKRLFPILQAYDNETYNNQTFTEHYFPEAFANGCTLSSLAEPMWKLFKESANLQLEPRLTMEDACTYIEYIFKHYGHYAASDNVSSWITADILSNSLKDTGVISKLAYYENQELMKSGL